MKILIVNSQGHWLNGWMTFAESQANVIEILKKGGCTVKAVEVTSPAELDDVLKNTSKDTLIWANAYWVNGENKREVGLIEQIEKYNLPMVGSKLKTLSLLLEKDNCQHKLATAGIAVPQYIVFQNGNLNNVQEQIERSKIAFPLVVKPTKESRSHGVTKVENIEDAVVTIHRIGRDYPFSNIIVEEFLPTNDITCGYIKLKDEIIILPSFNSVKGMDCSQEIFSEKHYQLPSEYEQQVIIDDKNILQQLEDTLPKIADILGINGVTRIDARLDIQGKLKVFDINGMPGLNYPISALLKQCFSHFPSYSKEYLFECLINTILLESFQEYQMILPSFMEKNHLFNLKSKTIIKLKGKLKKIKTKSNKSRM
jgi:D-alanine-D-alanine ligase-like ATP-grasp enzyme